ncbi:MAG: hypothetical protein AB1793_06860 [Candidatus Thermoplasmatota archaeon]
MLALPTPPRPPSHAGAIAAGVVAFIVVIVVVLAYTSILSVPSGDGGVVDPVGTVTTNIRTDEKNWFDFESGSQNVPNCDFYVDSTLNFYTSVAIGDSMFISDVGPVSGLGQVTIIPTSGWTEACSIILGHGYVVQTTDNHYYGMYAVDWMTDAVFGGVIGLQFKWYFMGDVAV